MFNWNFLSNYNTNDVKHFQKGLVSKLYETNLWVNLNWESHYVKTIYSYSINNIEISIYKSIVVDLEKERQVE